MQQNYIVIAFISLCDYHMSEFLFLAKDDSRTDHLLFQWQIITLSAMFKVQTNLSSQAKVLCFYQTTQFSQQFM